MPPRHIIGNPLYLEWLEEAASDAADKGSKMEFAWKKAAKSVRACPIKFDHPEQTRQLVGVGDTIIKYLTRRQKKYCEEKGSEMPDKPEPVMKAKATAKKRKAAASRVHSEDEGNAAAGPSTYADVDAPFGEGRAPAAGHLGEDDNPSDDDPAWLRALAELENGASPTAKKKKKASTKPKKQYFPKKNSGAYAILLALHSASSAEDMHFELSKKEIIDICEAKGWCEASFNKAKEGSFATAWNGMSTLVSKGYCIQKGSRMAKFHLSEEGFNVAQKQYDLLPVDPFEQDRRDRLSQSVLSQHALSQPLVLPTLASLRDMEPTFRIDVSGMGKTNVAPPAPSPLDLLKAAAGRTNKSAGREALLRMTGRSTKSGSTAASVKDNRFYFAYLDKCDERVLDRAKARVKLLGDGFAHFKIELFKSQAQHVFVRSNVERLEPAPPGRPAGDETMFGWLPDDGDAPEMAVGLSRPPQPNVVPPSSSPRQDFSPLPGSVLQPQSAGGLLRVNSGPATSVTRKASSTISSRLETILALATNRSQSTSSIPSARAYSSTDVDKLSQPTPLGNDQGTHQRPRSSVTIASKGDVEEEDTIVDADIVPIVWHAGSYEIVLQMDHREKSGKKGEQGAIPLRDMGVDAETSNDMVLGDIMWVARRKDGGQEGGIQACVLDYIIERKRLDDLVSSIRDGRFREQKTRLKNSGIGQVIYLLEKFHVGEQQDSWWTAVMTSKSSMQIIDNFFVHETDSWEGSLSYLKSMHETIVDIHQGQDLYIIPDNKIHRPTYTELQRQLRLKHPSKPHLTSLQAFKRLNTKNASMTHRDVWCKMLLTIPGLSPEKVAAIVEVYPTLRSLERAFKAAEVAESQARAASVGQPGKPKFPLAQNLLVNDVQGSNRQKIGPALSKKVHELVRAQVYFDKVASDDD